MSPRLKTVKVLPGSELGLTLKAAQTSGEPEIVDTGEGRYPLLVTLAEPAGDVFAGVDRDQLLRDLHEQRAQASRGRPA